MRLRGFVFLTLLVLIMTGTVGAAIIIKRLPDLVITQFTRTGMPVVNSSGSVEVPVQVVVKNQGSAAAAIFKVSTEYTSSSGTYYVAFQVPGQGTYPFTSAPLGVGGLVAFNGKLVFIPSVRHVAIRVRAIADSISGDEFMPAYGRVRESNETNNTAYLSLTLP